MIGISSHNRAATESSRLMRGAVRDFDEYILELHPEIIVGLDVVAHVIVPEYYAKQILIKVVIVRWLRIKVVTRSLSSSLGKILGTKFFIVPILKLSGGSI